MLRSRAELQRLIDWVADEPNDLRVVSEDYDENLAVAVRYFAGDAGVTVVGTVNEKGVLIPEFYFPCLKTNVISSDAEIRVEKEATRNGRIGMCDDYRLGMPLIFTVQNVADAAEASELFHSVSLAMLLSDAVVLLPTVDGTDETLALPTDDAEEKTEELMKAAENDPEALQRYAREAIDRYERFMNRIQETDILTLVNSFFMPHGMESECYYFLGTIRSCQDYFNELTGERYYRMTLEANGVPFTASISEADLTGAPQEGYRLRGHGWLQGNVKP